MSNNLTRVTRTRPLVPIGWKCKIPIKLDPDLIDKDTFRRIAEIAGQHVGLGDWRPGAPKVSGTFGRFVVESMEEVKS